MKRRYHRWYRKTYFFNEKLTRLFTIQGAALQLLAFTLIFFGLNTSKSTLYMVFATAIVLMVVDYISLIGKRPKLIVKRFLPPFITKGQDINYKVSVSGKNLKNKEMFYLEIPSDPTPDYETFVSTPEPGESKRNRYDRRMGYYRWKWLVERNMGAKYNEAIVQGEMINDRIVFQTAFTPLRRGKIRLGGAYICKKGVFQLIRKGIIADIYDEVTVFPEIFPVKSIKCLRGLTESGNEKTVETEETGLGYELKSLREYNPGDSPRNIHWRASAKTGDLKVKEFHKEVDAGVVLFLDNFFKESYLEDFETIVSTAASLFNYLYENDRMPQGLVVGSKFYDVPETGMNGLLKVLSILATVEHDKSGRNIVHSSVTLLEKVTDCCSVIFLTPAYDLERQEVIDTIVKNRIPVSVIYSGEKTAGGNSGAVEVKVDGKTIKEGILL